MGLSGRKQKQRIANDPRNLAWSDDAARFGQAYLSKLGWDPSQGLGVGGEGRLSHVKVSQKLDMLGIGAAQQRDPNGIAWKQNKDFEALLERLNGGTAAAGGKVPMAGFDAAREVEAEIPVVEVEVGQKRKREENSDAVDQSDDDEKRRKKEKKEKKEKKRKAKDPAEADDSKRKASQSSPEETIASEAAVIVAPAPYVPRVKAHRRRVLASKDIASKSASSIAEILGVSRTPSSSSTPVPLSAVDLYMGALTTISDELTKTSATSVEDYFKARLLAKSKLSTSTIITPSSETESPADPYSEMDAAPRRGIGASSLSTSMTPAEPDAEANRIGLSAFSMLRTSAFLNASTSFQLPSVSEQHVSDSSSLPTGGEGGAPSADVSSDDSSSKKRKRSQGNSGSVEDGPTVVEEVVKKSKKDKKEKKEKKLRTTDAAGVLSSETKKERKARRKAEKASAKGSPLAEASAEEVSTDSITPAPSSLVPEAETLTKEQRKAAKAERKSEKQWKRQLKAAS